MTLLPVAMGMFVIGGRSLGDGKVEGLEDSQEH